MDFMSLVPGEAHLIQKPMSSEVRGAAANAVQEGGHSHSLSVLLVSSSSLFIHLHI